MKVGWFSSCDNCGIGVEVVAVAGQASLPDPDESDETLDCPYCGRWVKGWSEL